MATPGYFTLLASYESTPNFLYFHFKCTGGSGAFTATRSQGFGTMTRTGTGAYTLPLAETWISGTLFVDATVVPASYSKTGVDHVQIVQSQSSDLTAPEYKLLCVDAAGDATELSSGDVVMVKVEVQQQPNNAG